MKALLKIESFFILVLSVVLAYLLPFPGWIYWALFLSPDLSMLGYLHNTRTGAAVYNFFHHQGLAVAAYVFGIYFQIPEAQFSGLLLLGHSAFDRMLGYGLKLPDNFHNTHLGWIGKAKG